MYFVVFFYITLLYRDRRRRREELASAPRTPSPTTHHTDRQLHHTTHPEQRHSNKSHDSNPHDSDSAFDPTDDAVEQRSISIDQAAIISGSRLSTPGEDDKHSTMGSRSLSHEFSDYDAKDDDSN